MSVQRRPATALSFAIVALFIVPHCALAQSAKRDAIGELLKTAPTPAPVPSLDPTKEKTKAPPSAEEKSVSEQEAAAADPRDGDLQYEQAKALMVAVDAILNNAAGTRAGAQKLPSRDDYIIPPFWKETREDRDAKVRDLLDAALAIVTDVPVVDVQKKLDVLRRNIREIEDANVKLKEKQLVAPKDAGFGNILTDTVADIDKRIAENVKRIEANREQIKAEKEEIAKALRASGIELQDNQIDLLLDSVLSGDLVRLVAVFNAAKMIDGQLAKLISTSGDNMTAARRYFAMHAALFAMLVQAQDATITKIDTHYLPRLEAIIADIAAARGRTAELLKAENRPDQQRALESNRESQKLADSAAKAYRRYLQQQREQIAKARLKATHDLKIADNTYETVEASVQLRNLMRDSSTSFEAIQRLESPSFEQIFKNDELRREFENLTRKLDVPAS
ncbi:hypothetical protein DLM45_03295 [Hyphomicrobium methylovorum]|uniref:hypothetical protein n=1 Tax=Hyphomicrobium methylovorum TaxID=84 RepID=UPI0015E6E9DC|nr:hypothetical protein [Hyphomicrobium methylovorum]MBA2125249.1 hypothetical protein [Hyphomicrobium methylovorum]